MTLVAAFKISGIPVLLGDFLLTDEIAGKNHIFLPTVPQLRRAANDQRRVCGLRKKIHKVGERLVVGFTGGVAPGVELMKRLIIRFGASEPSVESLRAFLADEEFPRKSETALVGWICDKRPLCFRWNGKEPEVFRIVDSAFDGSGARHFQEEVMPAHQTGKSDAIRTAFDNAMYVAVTKIGKILLQEILNGRTIDHAYGFGGEILIWDGARFAYVANVAFAFWNVIVRSDDALWFSPRHIAAYRNYGKYSVLQITHIGPKENPAEGLESKETYVQVITPMDDEMASFEPSSVGRQSLESQLWFSGIVVRNPAKQLETCFTMVSECSDAITPFAQYRSGVLSMNIARLYELLPPQVFNCPRISGA
jgi:hypothetical protein